MLLPILLLAQITAPQLAIPTPAPGQVRLMALVGDSFKAVEMGPGLKLTDTGAGLRLEVQLPTVGTGLVVVPTPGGYRLEINNPATWAWVIQPVTLPRAPDGTYTGYPTGAAISRNGVLQPPAAYTVSGGTVTPIEPWQAGDTVVAWRLLQIPGVSTARP